MYLYNAMNFAVTNVKFILFKSVLKEQPGKLITLHALESPQSETNH